MGIRPTGHKNLKQDSHRNTATRTIKSPMLEILIRSHSKTLPVSTSAFLELLCHSSIIEQLKVTVGLKAKVKITIFLIVANFIVMRQTSQN